jgi:UDP-N-acetylmuramyl pentapeptide phosphotransferase/UDP-N-acetylglucosamine-1-phosphate transferase
MWLGLLAFVLSTCTVEAVRRTSLRRGWLDRPGVRSSHVQPTPRIGGVGVIVTWSVGLAVAALTIEWRPGPELALLLAGAVVIAVIGFVDDVVGLRASVRFALQVAVAALFVTVSNCSYPSSGQPVSIAVSIVWIVWVTNLFNFMDGSDGLAGGQAVIALLAFGELLGGNTSVVAFVGVGALFGFLLHNIAPARIFMGDALSTSLGFVFGGLGLLVARDYHSPWPGVLPIYVFVFDATATLLVRFVRGEPWWSAHRSHGYQLLLQRGWSHRTVQMLYLVFATCTAELALWWPHLDVLAVCAGVAVATLVSGAALWWLRRGASATRKVS